jgi:hypothetical protein
MTITFPRATLPAAVAALFLLGGCTGHDLVANAARPGKYRLYNCDQLNKRGVELVKREAELQGLIDKARQGPGGEIAIALAYMNEFNTVQGELREIDITGTDKNCQLKYRTISDGAVR